MRIYRKSQLVKEHVESPDASWWEKRDMDNIYLGIGHQEIGAQEEMANIIWVFKDGQIDYRKSTDENVLNHVLVWGNDVEKYYNGRYEPDTGKLSIVKPYRHKFRDVPSSLMKALREKFPGIKEINIFS